MILVVTIQDVVAQLRTELDLVEARLLRSTAVEYPLVGDFLSAIVKGGGKRLRPLLLFLSARPFHYDPELLTPAAAGIELLHTASLVHDDTIDNALLRRGQPTLNSAFSSEAVILLGDYLFAQSAILATETMNPRVVRVFATSLGSICDGQLREIFDGARLDQTEAEYEQRIYGKTASLFAAAAEMGAILGGAGDDAIEMMRGFGTDVGMAFQIVDDVLDFRSTSEQVGKPVGADLRQGTITLPTMLYLEGSDGAPTATLVRRIIDGEDVSEAELVSATREISASGAIDTALEKAEAYVEQAVERLSVLPAGEPRDLLEVFARSAVEREY